MKRAGRIVALCFGASIIAALALCVVYLAGGQTQLEGALLGVALGGIGLGLLVWAGALMPHIREQTHPRPAREPQTDGPATADVLSEGVEEIRRRTFLSRLLLAAAGALGLAAVFPIRSLGQAPGVSLARTSWRSGDRAVTADGEPVTLDTLVTGSAITVFPEGHAGSSDSQAVLIRVEEELLALPEDRGDWAPSGLVAYSKLCTHAGCPLTLYLAANHELRCPCHQSTFNVLNGAEPIYGPAARALPQLPLQVQEDRTIVALGDFSAPVGPAFWELDSS